MVSKLILAALLIGPATPHPAQEDDAPAKPTLQLCVPLSQPGADDTDDAPEATDPSNLT